MALRIRATHWLLAGGLLSAASPAFAQEGMLFKNLMDGIVGKRNNDIEYRQRPALVVPPASTLPRPQEPGSARSAAWPNDPDVARRRADRANALIPSTEREAYKDNQRPLLSQEELRRGRTAGSNRAPVVSEEANNYNNQIQPIVIGREMALRRNEDDVTKLNYGTEPRRERLVDPPLGYRRPAGSAPVGPGAQGPLEDKQAAGIREFQQGTIPIQ